MLFNQLLEYIDNGNLFSFIKKNGPVSEKEALRIFQQIGNAVEFLHNNNMIHRDIKPENILLTKEKDAKLCDFGWCAELSLGNRATFCGTFEYMAPELVKETPYDKAIDVWSLGILLFEMVHAHSPFKANSAKDYEGIFENILDKEIPFREDCTEEFKKIVTRCLEKDANKRPKINELLQKEVKKVRKNSMKEFLVKTDSPIKKENLKERDTNLVNKVLRKLDKKPTKAEVKGSTSKKVTLVSSATKPVKMNRNASLAEMRKVKKEVELDIFTLNTKDEKEIFKQRSSQVKTLLGKEDITDTLSILESACHKRLENSSKNDDKGFWKKVGSLFTPFKCGVE